MGYQDRRRLISDLEKSRESRVVCYVLSDRQSFPAVPGFTANLDSEPHLLLVDHLRAIGRSEKLDLFLYTRGGATDSVWPLVRLLREHCARLSVVVPFRAHSAGTLICLGADEIVMTSLAELSPIDPTTGNQFNPADPTNPQNRYGISVEDVAAYFTLSEERAAITQEPYKLEVLKQLTDKVHPLALGNVQRVYMQIRRLARELLTLHMDKESDAQKIEGIVQYLTERFYSHVHAITRSEAMPLLGEWVREPSREEEPAIWALFHSYAESLQLRRTFNLPEYMGDTQLQDLHIVGGYLESTEMSHIAATDMKVSQMSRFPPNVQVQLPPGAGPPLVAWGPRTYEYSLQQVGWRLNEEGE